MCKVTAPLHKIPIDKYRRNDGNRKNHHPTNITLILFTGKNCQWRLKLEGKRITRNRVFAQSPSISSQDIY